MWHSFYNHEQKTYVLLEAFAAGLDVPTSNMLNNASNGGIGKMRVYDVLKFYDDIASSTLQ